MNTIWKKTIGAVNNDGIALIEVPQGSKFLTVQIQNGSPAIWFLCDPDQPFVVRAIQWVGTGIEVRNPDALVYIATVQQHNGTFVSHFFERIIK